MTRSARRYHGSYLVVAQYCMSRRSLVLPRYATRKLVAADRLADRVADQLLIMLAARLMNKAIALVGLEHVAK
jgi:hypothetical protein